MLAQTAHCLPLGYISLNRFAYDCARSPELQSACWKQHLPHVWDPLAREESRRSQASSHYLAPVQSDSRWCLIYTLACTTMRCVVTFAASKARRLCGWTVKCHFLCYFSGSTGTTTWEDFFCCANACCEAEPPSQVIHPTQYRNYRKISTPKLPWHSISYREHCILKCKEWSDHIHWKPASNDACKWEYTS